MAGNYMPCDLRAGDVVLGLGERMTVESIQDIFFSTVEDKGFGTLHPVSKVRRAYRDGKLVVGSGA